MKEELGVEGFGMHDVLCLQRLALLPHQINDKGGFQPCIDCELSHFQPSPCKEGKKPKFGDL